LLFEKLLNIKSSNDFSHNEFQDLNNNIICNLISELFSHINSKEKFNYISNFFLNSLGKYKKKFQIESFIEYKECSLSKDCSNEIKNSQYIIANPEDEYLAISNDLHTILSNCSEFSNSQKLDFCNNQRYFMKLYLKELLTKLNKIIY